ncbi:hypothetical protein CORC01_11729 [Colletotrichum orchidophilum]|uniref:Uncharacterized protein n=1 Tax=Colletotrichum orchidophilum TaxID=1209926 RepID=A0A1G4AV80_9PEZI|nr:uncharacterized protein CORC01_11729 [Colletotrichum orchidophilum]OHE93006.1 hypothetical protein CORC01_11729 [Colletotrichum orchidophilum]
MHIRICIACPWESTATCITAQSNQLPPGFFQDIVHPVAAAHSNRLPRVAHASSVRSQHCDSSTTPNSEMPCVDDSSQQPPGHLFGSAVARGRAWNHSNPKAGSSLIIAGTINKIFPHITSRRACMCAPCIMLHLLLAPVAGES